MSLICKEWTILTDALIMDQVCNFVEGINWYVCVRRSSTLIAIYVSWLKPCDEDYLNLLFVQTQVLYSAKHLVLNISNKTFNWLVKYIQSKISCGLKLFFISHFVIHIVMLHLWRTTYLLHFDKHTYFNTIAWLLFIYI